MCSAEPQIILYSYNYIPDEIINIAILKPA